MAPLELQGNTLGEKHKCYNELLRSAVENYPLQMSPIDYHDSDVSNMLKIDVACSRKDVNYILEVLRCQDMLYVSRTIKKSLWLVTDEEFAHIINPKYLNTKVFPQMSVKAKHKFLLYIRLNLKNEIRVEEFFNHYKDINILKALKWLPNCSLIFIENAIKTYKNKISVNILKRLCEKSIIFLAIYLNCKTCKPFSIHQIMEATSFLMNKHLAEYLDILETLDENEYPIFSPKLTKLLMKRTPKRIFNNFEKYANSIHLQTFVKFIKPQNIGDFLLQHCKNSKLKYWFNEDTVNTFLMAMPDEKRSNFVRSNIIEKENEPGQSDILELGLIPKDSYHWYKYVQFETAFNNIVKLIKAESTSSVRMSMMEVLLFSARKNMVHIEKLLQYFRDNHINESFVYKRKFLISLVQQVDTFRLNDQAWENLNVLFLSIEDYNDAERKEQCFIKAAIMRKILRKEEIPVILEKSFSFETLKLYRNQLNDNERDMTFNYLYSYAIKKMNQQNISNISEFKKEVGLVKNVLSLLSDWEKDLVDFPDVLTKIMKLIDIKKTQFGDVNLSDLYNVKKSWRKSLFPLSLDLSLSQETCINALKHDSNLLMDSNHFMDVFANRAFTNLQQFLSKIRIYWPTSLANEATSYCLDHINSRGDEALIKHIMYLLPINPLREIAMKYIPKEETIDWNEDNKILLSIRKNIAKHIYIARPQPAIEIVLCYAKGDYLQFAVSSLNSILHNMDETSTRTCILHLMEAPVSLKKHVIRIAIDKLNYEEIIQIFSHTWKETKNKSIRADLFKTTFKLLCMEKNDSAIESIWTLMDYFIDSLTDKENSEIYNILTRANEVPVLVKVAFWKKSVQFFRALPPSSNQRSYVEQVLFCTIDFIEIIDINVLADILIENFKHNMLSYNYNYPQLIASCILSTKTMESQLERYDKFFFPVMELCVTSWNIKQDNKYIYRMVFDSILGSMCDGLKHVLAKQMMIPDVVFKKILDYLEQRLPTVENYVLLRTWKFSYKLVKIIGLNLPQFASDEMDTDDDLTKYCNFVSKAIPQLGEELIDCLREDINLYYPSIYICFGDAIFSMWRFFNFLGSIKLQILKSILSADLKESYLVVLELIPNSELFYESTREILEIISSHPSSEVKFHYYNRRQRNFY